MAETHDVGLREMVEAMAHLPDDTVFRWYQASVVIPDRGWHQPTVTMRITLGQVRQELARATRRDPLSISDLELIRDIWAEPLWHGIMQDLGSGSGKATDIAASRGAPIERVMDAMRDLEYEGLVTICDDEDTCRLEARGRHLLRMAP